MYRCPTGDCKGCNSTCVGCSQGSEGPLCSLCSSGFYLREASNRCTFCSADNAWLGPLLVLTVLGIALAILYKLKDRLTQFYEDNGQ